MDYTTLKGLGSGSKSVEHYSKWQTGWALTGLPWVYPKAAHILASTNADPSWDEHSGLIFLLIALSQCKTQEPRSHIWLSTRLSLSGMFCLCVCKGLNSYLLPTQFWYNSLLKSRFEMALGKAQWKDSGLHMTQSCILGLTAIFFSSAHVFPLHNHSLAYSSSEVFRHLEAGVSLHVMYGAVSFQQPITMRFGCPKPSQEHVKLQNIIQVHTERLLRFPTLISAH